jgi:hypothetical protein
VVENKIYILLKMKINKINTICLMMLSVVKLYFFNINIPYNYFNTINICTNNF